MKPLLFYFASIFIFLFSCSSEKEEKIKVVDTVDTKKDIISIIDSVKPSPLPELKYYLVGKKIGVEWNFDSLSTEKQNILFAINRIDLADVWKADSLVFPELFLDSLIDYTPFPKKISSIAAVRKLLLVSYKIQAFGAYENGVLVRWGPVSMGKRSTPTPTGLFHTNWKSKETISTVDSGWVLKWYFNFDNFSGVSLHEYELPGYPASHSCIRLYPEDAYFFYYWAEQWILESDTKIAAYGTPLIIFGEYPFRKRKPWLSLSQDPHYLDFTESDLKNVIDEFLPLIIERQIKRDSIPDI